MSPRILILATLVSTPAMAAVELSDAGIAPDAPAVATRAGTGTHFGASMPLGRPIGIDAALARADRWVGKQGKFAGRVVEVCQKEGCWLVLAEGERTVRVFTDHSFFVPKDTSGRAVVYGRLAEHRISEERARHLAEDAGRDAGGIVGEQTEYQIHATSIQLQARP